jgi:hypothetical protein
MKVHTLALVAVSLFTATHANAADTALLNLRGIVPLINEISVSPVGTNNLNLNITGGESNKQVANVSETSNNLLGYKINAKSLNNSELRNTSDATKKTVYRLSYNGGAMTTLTQNYQQVKNVSLLNLQGTATSAVAVEVTALPGAIAGSYEDTVTFQIVANQ